MPRLMKGKEGLRWLDCALLNKRAAVLQIMITTFLAIIIIDIINIILLPASLSQNHDLDTTELVDLFRFLLSVSGELKTRGREEKHLRKRRHCRGEKKVVKSRGSREKTRSGGNLAQNLKYNSVPILRDNRLRSLHERDNFLSESRTEWKNEKEN